MTLYSLRIITEPTYLAHNLVFTPDSSQEIKEGGYNYFFFGAVHDLENNTSIPVAISERKITTDIDTLKTEAARLTALNLLNSPYITPFYGMWGNNLIFERAHTDLSVILEQVEPTIPVCEVSKWIHNLLSGLACLHALDLVHRDIKPENLYINALGILMLGDFGLAMHRDSEEARMITGTYEYFPPEFYAELASNNQALSHPIPVTSVDLYAAGATIQRMIYGLILQQPNYDLAALVNKLLNSVTPEQRDMTILTFLSERLQSDEYTYHYFGLMRFNPFEQNSAENALKLLEDL